MVSRREAQLHVARWAGTQITRSRSNREIMPEIAGDHRRSQELSAPRTAVAPTAEGTRAPDAPRRRPTWLFSSSSVCSRRRRGSTRASSVVPSAPMALSPSRSDVRLDGCPATAHASRGVAACSSPSCALPQHTPTGATASSAAGRRHHRRGLGIEILEATDHLRLRPFHLWSRSHRRARRHHRPAHVLPHRRRARRIASLHCLDLGRRRRLPLLPKDDAPTSLPSAAGR